MEFNANDAASINIMEYSLCLDDHPTPSLLNQMPQARNLENNSKLSFGSSITKPNKNQFKFDKNTNNFNSFYLTNDYDATDSNTQLNNHRCSPKEKPNIIKENDDDADDDDDDEIIFNLNGEYRNTSDKDKNSNAATDLVSKMPVKNQTSNVNINSNNNSGSINNNNGIELDSVKHKLSSIWNNVKYGWANYLKKPNKIELNTYQPIFILGKKFYYNDFDDENSYGNERDLIIKNKKHTGSTFYDYFDNSSNNNNYKNSNKNSKNMTSLNESYINAPSLSSILSTNEYDEFTNRQISSSNHNSKIQTLHNINNDDYLAMTYSYLSTSPFETNNFASLFNKNDSKSTSIRRENSFNHKKMTNLGGNSYDRFLNDNMKTPLDQEIYSRLWFTYRKDFEPLDGNNKYTTDCGWGCMLRSAQMLIAQGLLMHLFNKDWSLYKSIKSNKDSNTYKEIISLFNDRPSLSCPFGLHRLLEIADEKLICSNLIDCDSKSDSSANLKNNNNSKSNTRVGTWFGPTSVCLLMKDALNEATKKQNSIEVLNNIRIYVAQDCTIFKQDVIDLCTKPQVKEASPNPNQYINIAKHNTPIDIPGRSFTPCIILISARLGGEELNEIYVDSLKMFLEMDICIGIIGGKPKHSLYFIGYQGDKVIYLDPHFCQPTINIYSNSEKKLSLSLTHLSTSTSSRQSNDDSCLSTSSISNSSDYDYFDNTSFHCSNPSKVAFTKLDPSIAIGFYCKNLEDLNKLCDLVKETSANDKVYPIFGIADGRFEEAQLNYQSFSIDEKFLSSKLNTETKTNHHEHYNSKLKTPESTVEKDQNQTKSNISKNHNIENKNSTITSYLTSKISNTISTKSQANSGESRKHSQSRSILSPSKTNKKFPKKSADPDDFVLV